MRKILFSLLIIGAASVMVIGGTMAFFRDTEISSNNTFTAGTIEIGVNGQLHWSETFNWDDIKPGKDKEITLAITNEGVNPVKLWKIIKCVETEENGIIEPEQAWYDEYNEGNPKNDIDSAIIYEMYVDGRLAIAKEAGITMNQIKDNYIGLVKLDKPFESGNGDGILYPGESITVVERYFMPEGTENWAQSDKMTFVTEIEARQISAPEPLRQMIFMENKNVSSSTWPVIADETMGILKYDYMALTFNYDFFGVGLNSGTEYCLIYYADDWPGNHPGALIASGTPSIEGKLELNGSKNLGIDLPDANDKNYPYAAKIWLVYCDDYNQNTNSIKWPWSPDNYVFDNWPGLINYRQGDRPNEELNCDYGKNNSAGAGCTDADGDYYFTETSGCESEPGYLGHNDCDDNNIEINLGTAEICDDGLDNDCDGDIDSADSDCSSALTTPASGDIVINEVAWMGTIVDYHNEWMELKNMTDNDIDLTDCTFNAQDGTPLINLSGTITANGYYLLEKDDDNSVPGITADKIYTGALENNGEYLELRDSNGDLIDEVNANSIWPAGDNGTKQTMEQCDNGSWHDSDVIGGTPRAANSSCTMIAYLNQLGEDIDVQYGYQHDYTAAAGNNVAFTYNSPMTGGKISGIMSASGLKPYATYQVKLTGNPTCLDPVNGNDLANEYVGYKGRWTCPACPGNANARNRTDSQYMASSTFRGDGSECIVGYLVFDYFTADASGNIEAADMEILSDTSYHVLFCGGGTCNSNSNNFTAYGIMDSGVQFCQSSRVNGQPQSGRGGCGGLTLDAGVYNLKMSITEESFHQPTAPAGTLNWAVVLVGDIDFEIQ